jgi:MoaA/NifB/PqqE/SkfB family radical SAM enzyme
MVGIEAYKRFVRIARQPIQKCARLLYPIILRVFPIRSDRSDVTTWAMLEVTSRCNLRCVYCGKSSDTEENRRVFDLPEEHIRSAIKLLQDRGLRLLYMSGIGETTTRKGWDRICRDTLNTGILHTIITNLARPLSDGEAEVLARFASVQVSVDTADPGLFARIRRGAKLPNVLANMARIQDAARRIGVRGPELRFDMVVTDKTVHGMPETVRLGLANGVTDFYFAGLYKIKDVPNAENVQHVKTLPPPELQTALESLELAIRLAKEAGCKVQVHDGLLESIKTTLTSSSRAPEKDNVAAVEGVRSWDGLDLEPGWTRDCLDPWEMVFLYAQGEVRPCCTYDKGVGNVNEKPLRKILNGSSVRAIRRNLLTGSLDGMICAHCSMRNPIRAKDFRRKMKAIRFKLLFNRVFGKRVTDWLAPTCRQG